MHSVFLYHAIAAGMDMGIVNAGQLDVYDTIEPELREACEDVVLNRREDATERLLAIADRFKGNGEVAEKAAAEWRGWPVRKGMEHALVNGIDAFVGEQNEAPRQERPRPVTVLDGPTLAGSDVAGGTVDPDKLLLPPG